MRFEFVAKHQGIWPVSWICEALDVSRSGFHAWLVRAPSANAKSDEELGARVCASVVSGYRTYGARRVWHDLLAEGLSCDLHRVERLMRVHGLKARSRRRGLPKDDGLRSVIADRSGSITRHSKLVRSYRLMLMLNQHSQPYGSHLKTKVDDARPSCCGG